MQAGMKWPLLLFAVLYAAGILISAHVSLPLGLLFLLSFGLLGGAFLWPAQRIRLLFLLAFLAGWTNTAWRTAILSPHDLRLHFSPYPELAVMRGTLLETPQSKALEENTPETTVQSRARMQVDAVQTDHGWKPAHGTVLVVTPGPIPSEFRRGHKVEISGAMQPPPGALAEGLFDYRAYLQRHDIHYQLTAHDGSDWVRVPGTTEAITAGERFVLWAQRTLIRGLPEEDESLHLIYAMTLGWKSGLDTDTSERFMKSGTMHIFAISGLHIALIAGILSSLLRALRLSRQWSASIVIPLLWLYTAATGWQPSAVRSTIMMTIVLLGWSLKRPNELLNSLGAAALIILLLEPQQLFQASFQLSFVVVMSLGLFLPPLEKWHQQLLQPDPLLPPELRPRWQRWLDRPFRFFTTSLVTSAAAWIGSALFAAHYFHLFTPVSLLANLAVVPLSGLALMSTLGSWISAVIFPPFTECFNHAAWLFMTLMVWFSDFFTGLPAAFLHIRSPSTLEFACYYGLLITIATGTFFKSRYRKWLWIAAGIGIAAWIMELRTRNDAWKITVMPLAGGDSILVDAPGRREDLLIDCGDGRSSSYVVHPFLKTEGRNRIPHLLLTHGDVRHTGGATNILSHFAVGKVFTSPVRFRSSPYRKLLEELDETDGLRSSVSEGDRIAGWSVLYPQAEDKLSQADDGPVVLERTINGIRFLFLSDLARHGQQLLMERHPDLTADVVVSGLTRGSEPLGQALLEQLKPRLIVITDADYPATERAPPELRRRLKQCGVPVLFTRETGTLTFQLSDKGVQVNSMKRGIPVQLMPENRAQPMPK